MDWIELSAENGLGHFDRPRREVYKAKAFNKSVEVFKKRNPDLWKTDVKQRLRMAMGLLLKDIPLPPSFKDHQLKGNLSEYRECHISKKDDNFVFIYKKETLPDGKRMFRPYKLCTHDEMDAITGSLLLGEGFLNELLDSLE